MWRRDPQKLLFSIKVAKKAEMFLTDNGKNSFWFGNNFNWYQIPFDLNYSHLSIIKNNVLIYYFWYVEVIICANVFFNVFKKIFISCGTLDPQVSEFKIGYFPVNILLEIIIDFLSVWLTNFTVSSDLIISDLPCLNFIFLIGRGTVHQLHLTIILLEFFQHTS